MTELGEACHRNFATTVDLLNQVIGEISASLELAEDPQLLSLESLSEFIDNDCPGEVICEAYNRLIVVANPEGESVPKWLSWIYGVRPNGLIPSHVMDARRWILNWSLHRTIEIDELCAQRNLDFLLAPLLRAWLHRPRRIEAAPQGKQRIVPAKLAMARDGERLNKRFAKFAPAVHVIQQADGGQLVLSGFERPDYPRVALPLELWRIGGGNGTSPGRGAPWALRMFIAAVLSSPRDQMHGFYPLDIPITLRDLLDRLYPTSNRPGPSRWCRSSFGPSKP